MLIFLLFEVFTSYATNVDSLINVFNKSVFIKNDSILYKISHDISFYSNDPNQKLYYAQKAFYYSCKWNNTKYKAGSKYLEASAYIQLGNYSQAIRSLYNSKKLYNNINDNQRVSYVLSRLADIYTSNKQFLKAEKIFKESIFLLNDIINSITDSINVNYYKKNLAITHLNLGELYRTEKKYGISIINYNKADSIFTSLYYTKGIAYAKGNIGLVYVSQNKLDSAQIYLQDAITYLEEQNDNYAVSSYMDGLAELYLKQNKIQKALITSQKSLNLARDYGLKEQIRDASYRLSTIYSILNNFKQALEYQKQYVIYKDSLNNEDVTRQIANIQTEYEVAQKQKEVDQEKARKDTYRVIMLAIIGIAVLLLTLIISLLRSSYKRKTVNNLLNTQKQELEEANTIKNQFFSILSHDLRSPLAAFCSYTEILNMYAETKEFDQLEDTAKGMQNNANNLLDMLDNLLQWGIHQMNQTDVTPSEVNVQELVNKEVTHLRNVSLKKDIEVRVEIDSSIELKVTPESMSIAIRNLINNAIKFTPTGGLICIRASEEEQQTIIEVEDNGVGMPQDKVNKLFNFDASNSTYGTDNEKGVGLGLQLVLSFINSHNAQLEVESEEGKGTIFRMVFGYNEH